MPEMPDVVSGENVESAWGNDIRDRTLQRYADSTERDALNPLPIAGDQAWLDAELRMTYYTGTAWADVGRGQFNALNRGILLANFGTSLTGTWWDWGDSMNLGPGDPGRNWVTAQLSGSILTAGTDPWPATSTWRVRIGISADGGSSYTYAPAEAVWGVTPTETRRGILSTNSFRDIDPLGTNSVRIKAEVYLSASPGGNTIFESGILTAQMMRSQGTT